MSLRADYESIGSGMSLFRRWVTPITASIVLMALTTAVLWFADTRLKQDHLIFLYFLPTALIAIRYGSISAVGVTIASGIAAAYLLYSPRFSLLVANPLDMLELALFTLLAMLASQVVSGFASDRRVAKRRPRVRAAAAGVYRRSAGALWRRIRSARP